MQINNIVSNLDPRDKQSSEKP